MQNWQELDTDIVRIAARLTPDEMLRDDLAQEMRVRVWQAPDGKTRAWYLATARWHAVKFLTRTAVDCPDGDLDRQVTLYGVLGDVAPEVLRYIPADWQETLLSAPIDLSSETLLSRSRSRRPWSCSQAGSSRSRTPWLRDSLKGKSPMP